jgi:hypothetical protein
MYYCLTTELNAEDGVKKSILLAGIPKENIQEG